MNKKVTIVIAEDDAGHANLLIRNVRRAGCTSEIRLFTDGEQTLDYFFNNTSDLAGQHHVLLLDIRMPKIDGITVLSKLKQKLREINIPVIIISSTDDPQEIKKCYKLGCSNYMVKPIDYERFVEAIHQAGVLNV